MSNINRYTKFIAEQVRKSSIAGLRTRSLEESAEENDHVMISHPIETLHAGDNKNRTGKALTNRHGDFSKEYHNQEHHYNQIVNKLAKHKDANIHDGAEDEAGHVSFKKGSAAHELVKDHLNHVDHYHTSAAGHKSGPNV